jgi:acyl carrier protein
VDIRQTVFDQILSVAVQQGKTLPPLTDDLGMLESGLDSLCVAILIANLDDELRVSPFESDNVEIPITFGDLVRLYENAVENASA